MPRATPRLPAFEMPVVGRFGVLGVLGLLVGFAALGWLSFAVTRWYVTHVAPSARKASPASAPVQAPPASVVMPAPAPGPASAPATPIEAPAPAPARPAPPAVEARQDAPQTPAHGPVDRTNSRPTKVAPVPPTAPAGRSAIDAARCAALNRKLQVETPSPEELQFLRNGCRSQ